MIKKAVFCLFFFVPLFMWSDTLSLAEEYEDAGKMDKAVTQYTLWLDANIDNNAYIETLIHTAEIIPELKESISFLEERRNVLSRKKRAYEVYNLLADLYEIKGDVKEALDYLKHAIRMSPLDKQVVYKIKYTSLLIETGEFTQARDMAVSVLTGSSDRGVQLEATLLILRIQIIKKNREEILTIIENLTQAIPEKELTPSFYLLAYIGYLASDESDKAWEMKKQLKNLYPQSPEWYLCSRDMAKVDWVYLPSRYLEPIDGDDFNFTDAGDPLPEPTAVAVSTSEPEPTPAAVSTQVTETALSGYYIQLGAFSDKENAEDLIKSLTPAGFDTEIYEVKSGGRTLYKVLVPVGAASQKGVVLQQLKSKGFSGFPIKID